MAEESVHRYRASMKAVMTPAAHMPGDGSRGSSTPSRGSISKPVGVKAMAAMFETASQESPYVPSPTASRYSQPNGMALGLSRVSTPSSRIPKPKASVASIEKDESDQRRQVPGRHTLPAGHHQGTANDGSMNSLGISQAAHGERRISRLEKPSVAQLRRTPDNTKLQKHFSKALALGDDRAFPNLGTMTRPAEQPPIAQRITFPHRPPSAPSLRQLSSETVSVRAASPGANSVLHSQIRNLQRQLDAKTEESLSLRRQLETMESMDIGTLSEQLRAAKQECAMWKARAEAAEKRVSALQRFTRRLRGINGGDAQNDTDRPSPRERNSTDTTGTEDREVVAERIRRAMKGMDGPRSSDGGAAAWWDPGRTGPMWDPSTGVCGQQQMVLTERALFEVWDAAQAFLADGDI
ncbi:hypothetical protein LX32DRAFT_225247 [Colletotrichum zoysiae]|uniref:Uncharacterized protein n=1 Tax=Colletotrichum zoysiae TaxID=1216348 RepID=A0AAD9HN22_9PEZI|nr:hypothetical protein LX32DRAFT_225247 [Colletotrichum zoysiae]